MSKSRSYLARTSRRRSGRFPRRSKSVVSSISVVRSAKTQLTGKVVEGGIVAETERVFRNLSAVLEAARQEFRSRCARRRVSHEHE